MEGSCPTLWEQAAEKVVLTARGNEVSESFVINDAGGGMCRKGPAPSLDACDKLGWRHLVWETIRTVGFARSFV